MTLSDGVFFQSAGWFGGKIDCFFNAILGNCLEIQEVIFVN